MTTGPIAAFNHRRRVGVGALLLAATFTAGLATGSGLPSAAAGDPAARPGSATGSAGSGAGGGMGQVSLACVASPVLDTSKPYLTLQHGVVVPGR